MLRGEKGPRGDWQAGVCLAKPKGQVSLVGIAVHEQPTCLVAHADGCSPPTSFTQVCMPPQQSMVFGSHVLRLVQSQLEACVGELGAQAFWWSNLAHLRALLCQAGVAGAGAGPAAAAQPLVENLVPQVGGGWVGWGGPG